MDSKSWVDRRNVERNFQKSLLRYIINGKKIAVSKSCPHLQIRKDALPYYIRAVRLLFIKHRQKRNAVRWLMQQHGIAAATA